MGIERMFVLACRSLFLLSLLLFIGRIAFFVHVAQFLPCIFVQYFVVMWTSAATLRSFLTFAANFTV